MKIIKPDPAAEFGAAMSINLTYQSARGRGSDNACTINLSGIYGGGDEFMRRVMLTARAFEAWCCRNGDWSEGGVDDCWPYLLEDKVGPLVLQHFGIDELPSADRMDLRCTQRKFRQIAIALGLPLLKRKRK